MPVRNIFFSGLILIIVGFITYVQAVGKYGLTTPLVALILFILGFLIPILVNQPASQRHNSAGLVFTIFLSCCFFLTVYLVNRQAGNSSILLTTVYTSCWLLPFIVFKNWQLYWLTFQPASISSWLLPVPYIKNNAISLHLNSIPFTFRLVSALGNSEQDFPVTAPGIKTLGMVFSELVHEERNDMQQADFSDIIDNSYSWMFYTREFGGLKSRQLDANLSLLDNRLKTNAIVTAKRQ